MSELPKPVAYLYRGTYPDGSQWPDAKTNGMLLLDRLSERWRDGEHPLFTAEQVLELMGETLRMHYEEQNARSLLADFRAAYCNTTRESK